MDLRRAAVALVLLIAGATLPATVSGRPRREHPRVAVRVIGHSVLGRPIVMRVVGDPAAPYRVLVVGCVHGNENAGEAITRRLASVMPPAGVSWLVVNQFNPDGCDAHPPTRQNADGVDLNRNSPWHWRPSTPGTLFYSGPRPLSEPESRAINRLVRTQRPVVSIWYHQHAALVDTSSGGDGAIEALYAATVHLPLVSYGVFPGSITTWQDHRFPADTAFVVELPAGKLSAAAVALHVAAIVAVSRALGFSAEPASPHARHLEQVRRLHRHPLREVGP